MQVDKTENHNFSFNVNNSSPKASKQTHVGETNKYKHVALMPCVALDIALIALIVRAMGAPMGATFTET